MPDVEPKASPGLDQARQQLYGEPPEAFVARRDALVKELRAAGDTEAAATLKRERRPTRLRWALRTTAAAHPAETDAFASAASAVAAAQSRGSGVRERTTALREAIAALAGEVATRTDVERAQVGDALRAIAAEPNAVDALRAGALDDVPATTGLGSFEISVSDRPGEATESSGEPGPDPRAQKQARARVTAAKKAKAVADRAFARAERALERATEAADAAARAAEVARDEAESAARELDEAESELA